MTHENAVALTHETPVVPYSGADEKQFRESLWKYLQTEIHPEIRKQSYLSSRPNFFTIRTYGINPVKKRFARGKAVKLTEQEKEEFRRKITRLVAIENEYTEGQKRREHYSELLAEVLKMDNVSRFFCSSSKSGVAKVLSFCSNSFSFCSTFSDSSHSFTRSLSHSISFVFIAPLHTQWQNLFLLPRKCRNAIRVRARQFDGVRRSQDT